MKYSDLLQESVKNADLSLAQISRRLKSCGVTANPAYLSRLQTGKNPPASDKLNDALAEVLKVDSIDLKTAAYREKIPPEVLERIHNTA